jgi:hypothetical protein
MPWSGGSFTRTNGVNTGATLWAQDRDDGTKILATRHDTNDQDMADGINSTLEKSGSNAATGNLNIGSNRLTAVADGTAKTDAATVNQIQSNGPAFQATDTGTANTHVIALTPAITAYAAGQEITFKAGAASTGASTLNVNTLGAKALKKLHDQDIASGDIESGSIVTAVYDGTNFQVTSQLATEGGTPGGSNTQVQYNSSGSFAGDADLTFDGTELTAAGVNLAAFSGVLEANAAFVDQVIFGPSVDGMAWSGLWSKASVFSSLMLATVEDAGADSQINIWDLTTKANTSPLGTVTLSGDATPTSIAAAMGYLIVGSEDGISIIDPHSGAWAERTTGWPRTLSTSTTPALAFNDVQGVAACISQQPPLDPRTGGPMPTFGVKYVSGSAQANSIIKYDGNVWDIAGDGTSQADYGIAFVGSRLITAYSDTQLRLTEDPSLITSDQSVNPPYFWLSPSMNGYNLAALPDTAASAGGLTALGAGEGLGLNFGVDAVGNSGGNGQITTLNAGITRAYNSGYLTYDIRGAWLANSKTVDRSYKANTLTENGTVTEDTVNDSGDVDADLKGYSGWSTSNYLSRADDSDYNAFGTGSVYSSIWFKSSGTSGDETLTTISNSGATVEFRIALSTAGNIDAVDDGATAQVIVSSVSGALDTGVWHKADFVRVSSTDRSLYVDGVFQARSTTDAGSLNGTILKRIGIMADNSSQPATTSTMALDRLSATAPTATQIRQMYDAEKGMFEADALCLLKSGSTDAVIDVDVDPLTGKVIATQTDKINIFDGLVNVSQPTVNSGSSEKGKLWGDLRAEQNSANAYVTAPAVDQRQVNEMVRGLASDLPAGVDLSKAKAWLNLDGTGTIAIHSSYNIKSVTDGGTGIYTVNFAIPFKSATGYAMAGSAQQKFVTINTLALTTAESVGIRVFTDAGADADSDPTMVVFFGELENE